MSVSEKGGPVLIWSRVLACLVLEYGRSGNMKESRLSIETYSMAIIGGLAIARFGGMNILGYGIMTIGGITTLGEIVKTFNPYNRLF